MKRLLGLLVVTGLAIGCGAEYVTDEVSSLRREVAELREQAATLLDQGAPVAESNALLAEASNLLLASDNREEHFMAWKRRRSCSSAVRSK